MALFFTVTLCISIVGILLLLGVKQWELANERLLWAQMRPRVGIFSHRVVVWVEEVLPALLKNLLHRAERASRLFIHRAVAYTILSVEHALERTLHFLRHTTDVSPGVGEASVFLREVAEHKKKLLKVSRRRSKVVPEKSRDEDTTPA